MALDIRIVGPGVDAVQRLVHGGDPVLVGRGEECAICLPDIDRSVSRRHVAVWNDAEELHFHVTSSVNGIEMPFGEAPPGARGVLPLGQFMRIGDYRLTVQIAEGDDPTSPASGPVGLGHDEPPPDDDPWTILESQHTGFSSFDSAAPSPTSEVDDPFGEWEFDSAFSPEPAPPKMLVPAVQPLEAPRKDRPVAEDISAFFRGLGVDLAEQGAPTAVGLEAAGRLVRVALIGLLHLHRATSGTRGQLVGDDGTKVARRTENNPLKAGDLSDELALGFLFGMSPPASGFVGPERALVDLLDDLHAHEAAFVAAARSVVEGTLREFDPDALKARLLAGSSRLFESSRAWDAFVRNYEERRPALDVWARRLMDRHFANAYQKELRRLNRETGSSA